VDAVIVYVIAGYKVTDSEVRSSYPPNPEPIGQPVAGSLIDVLSSPVRKKSLISPPKLHPWKKVGVQYWAFTVWQNNDRDNKHTNDASFINLDFMTDYF
jgi:hypothetical protein